MFDMQAVVQIFSCRGEDDFRSEPLQSRVFSFYGDIYRDMKLSSSVCFITTRRFAREFDLCLGPHAVLIQGFLDGLTFGNQTL